MSAADDEPVDATIDEWLEFIELWLADIAARQAALRAARTEAGR